MSPRDPLDANRRTTNHALSFIRTMTVGFGVAPNLLTSSRRMSARGLMRSLAITAGGEFHPALRTPASQERETLRFFQNGVRLATGGCRGSRHDLNCVEFCPARALGTHKRALSGNAPLQVSQQRIRYNDRNPRFSRTRLFSSAWDNSYGPTGSPIQHKPRHHHLRRSTPGSRVRRGSPTTPASKVNRTA